MVSPLRLRLHLCWEAISYTVCSNVDNTAFYLPVADVEDEGVKLVTLLLQMHHFKVKRVSVRVCLCMCVCVSRTVERAAVEHFLF